MCILREVVPSGMRLPEEEWRQRQRWIIALLWFHVPAVAMYGVLMGHGALHSATEGLPIAVLALLARTSRIDRRSRSMLTGLGLMVSSALLVHLSGGLTEMHFHFFVMLAVISLYQDWRPFSVSIAFVALHHGVVGQISPEDVFDDAVAWRAPLKWAVVHAFFVLCASAVSIVSWGIVEAGHRRSKAKLEASARRFRALIEHSSDVVTVFEQDGRITYDSPSSTAVLGYGHRGRIGLNGFDFVHPSDRALAEEVVAQVAASCGSVARAEVRVRHENGSYRWVEASVANLLGEPAVGGFVANFRDITDRKALEDQLAHQAFHDPLTGLANRALLLARAEHALGVRRRDADHVALLYLDLDDFKTVNDALGHHTGDDLLREVGARLTQQMRPGDTAARIGGDEFAVLLEGLPDHEIAYDIGARILESLQAPFEAAGGEVSISASIGVAACGGQEDPAELLRNADLAMYRAKGGGKGQFEVYEAGMHDEVVERMALTADMRRAVGEGEFEPYYQPIVDLESGRVTGVEALARWNHPERELVMPAAFIGIAEETGLIIPIGRAVLNRACEDAVAWLRDFGDEAPQSVSVNLSPRQIQDPCLVADVESALARSGLPPASLVLEITESILLDDTEVAAETLALLNALGVRIALDDFGTGYSSLTYLDRFPVDVLKIDKSFVDALTSEDAERASLVGAIVNLGMVLGLHVTAEGVECRVQMARLRSMGCELGQGFFFDRPMDAGTLRAKLEAGDFSPYEVVPYGLLVSEVR